MYCPCVVPHIRSCEACRSQPLSSPVPAVAASPPFPVSCHRRCLQPAIVSAVHRPSSREQRRPPSLHLHLRPEIPEATVVTPPLPSPPCNCSSPSRFLKIQNKVRLSIDEMATPSTHIIGGWNVIKDLSSPDVTEIANFAIDKGSVGLKLEKVLHGQSQVVAGFQFLLVLSAKEGEEGGEKSDKYLAVVLEAADKPEKELIFFAPYLV
ncbi:hypothetical protein PIB30_026770 [Stylosanthes scabra]|uniref:Cystatin domain-containing protein n=1 Tax=Stylosanthes scabra TaxID=79078 RepID=A0ABU6XCA0_9FABA|nr:hypothetical protein [Stylosanthes scabra]